MPISAAFDRLAPSVQRWIWEQNWSGLRDVQERAIGFIFDDDRDLVISAPTAGGKTEAAFLPIFSDLLQGKEQVPGFSVLAISPLKALINDQTRRLESLSDATSVALHKWHGDVSSSQKRKALKIPSGILLITPESLEAMFVLRGNEIVGLFAGLRFILVDELHALIASERGVQLQSLMHRVETAIGRSIRRIGLSATLGDLNLAKAALRPSSPDRVEALKATSYEAELLLQIKGYSDTPINPDQVFKSNQASTDGQDRKNGESTRSAIAAHLFKTLRGTTNLVFAGSREKVEIYADCLRRLAEEQRVPNEFLPHHGNLSKELRHDVENKLKEDSRPFSAVCTTTLELGIDIGDIESVAQIGAPTSISSLKQKLGRSGRRPGKPATLRIYTEETSLEANTPLLDRLRFDTALAVAAVELLLSGWCEPPEPRSLHLSTFLHQILSAIASRGGIKPAELYALLCATGPFNNIKKSNFVELLRYVSSQETRLIEQAGDGTLMLGPIGETLVEHYTFYAVFQTPEEYRVENNGKTLGTIPVDMPLAIGSTIIFAGRRWTLFEVRDAEKLLVVHAGSSGVPTKFSGSVGAIHDCLVQMTRDVLRGSSSKPYLDRCAKQHLEEGQKAFMRLGLDDQSIVQEGEDVYLFPWVGTYRLVTLQLALIQRGLTVSIEDRFCLRVKGGEDGLRAALAQIRDTGDPDRDKLAATAANKIRNKFDNFLSPELITADFAADQIRTVGLSEIAQDCLLTKNVFF